MRSALTERCPNTNAGSATGPHLGARSVSPPQGRYNPAPRSLRTKTPERSGADRAKTPEPARAKTPDRKRPAVVPSTRRPAASTEVEPELKPTLGLGIGSVCEAASPPVPTGPPP